MNVVAATDRSPRVVGKRDVRRMMMRELPVVRAHDVTNRLYAARGLRGNGLRWYWQLGRPGRIQEWISLAADDLRLQLALDGDAIDFDARQLDWRSYNGETRLLAWTACHERLIGLLRTLFQCDWLPQSISECDAVPRPDCVLAGFAVHSSDGLPITSGVTLLDPACIQRLACRAPFSEPRLHQPLRGVHARLPILLDEFEVAPAELAAIGCGAIVRLDNRTLAAGVARVAIPAGNARLIADVTAVRALVVGLAAPGPHLNQRSNNEGNHMANEHSPPERTPADPAPSATASDRGVAIGALPVRLTFTAGQVTLPFAMLADIGPGFVFELGRRLDDQAITIQANDTPIAVGELVVVGDLVGVRITRMLPRQ